MAELKLTLDGVKEYEDKLNEALRKWNSLSVPFKRAAIIVYASVKRNFSAGGRPSWPPLKSRKGQPLRDTGRLMASVTGASGILEEQHSPQRHTLIIGTNVAYANVHQFGFKGSVSQAVKAHTRTISQAWGKPISPRSVAVSAHSRTIKQNIPARPFLMLQDADRTALATMFREYLFTESLKTD